jgi:hypothetical protein
VVTTGRWAYTPIKANASTFSRYYNPYNLLRSPWNTNPVSIIIIIIIHERLSPWSRASFGHVHT